MNLRNVNDSDIELIKQNIKNLKFPVPLMETCIFKRTVIDSSGNFVGIGAVKLVGDIYLVFPESINPIKKAKAIKMLFNKGLKLSTEFGLSEWHAFLDDDIWSNEIKKHYGFKDIESKYKLSLIL